RAQWLRRRRSSRPRSVVAAAGAPLVEGVLLERALAALRAPPGLDDPVGGDDAERDHQDDLHYLPHVHHAPPRLLISRWRFFACSRGPGGPSRSTGLPVQPLRSGSSMWTRFLPKPAGLPPAIRCRPWSMAER